MKSKIIIDLDHDGSIIFSVKSSHDSEDVRDKMVSMFFEKLQYTSSWAKIECTGTHSTGDGFKYEDRGTFSTYKIKPIPPNEIEKEIYEMRSTLSGLETQKGGGGDLANSH